MAFNLQSLITKPTPATTPQMIMVYSPYGQGKTTFAASAAKFAETSPVLYLDLEGSTTGILNDVDPENVDIILPRRVKPRDPDNPTATWVQVVNRVVDHVISDPNTKYKTIVIDPLDVYHDWLIEYYDRTKEGQANKYYTWSAVAADITGSMGMLARLKASGLFSILVLHQRAQDEGRSVDFKWPGTKSREELPQYPDIVMYLTLDTDRHSGERHTEAQFSASGGANAKTRFDMPLFMTDVTVESLFTAIRNKEGA